MLLAIDVGNTNSKFAVFDGDKLVAQFRLRTEAKRTADEYAAWLTQLMHLQGFDPRVDQGRDPGQRRAAGEPATCAGCARPISRRQPLVVGEPDCRARHQGADRPAAGRRRRPPGRRDRRLQDVRRAADHRSISAAPRPSTWPTRTATSSAACWRRASSSRIESFYLMTARLPRIRVEKPEQVIGKATVPAMQSGIFWGYVGLIESLIKRIRAEYGEPMKVVATGGLATVFKDEIGLFDAIEPDLMSLGLLEIWRRNRRMTVPVERRAAVPRPGRGRRDRHEPQSLRPCRQVADGRSRHRLRRRHHAGRRGRHARSGLHRGAAQRPRRHRAHPCPRGSSRRRGRPVAAARGAGLCHAVRRLGAEAQAARGGPVQHRADHRDPARRQVQRWRRSSSR